MPEAPKDLGQQGCVSQNELGPFGQWEPAPQSPLWPDGPDGDVQNTTHANVFEDAQGQWWAVFSGTRSRKVDEKWTESVLGKSSISRQSAIPSFLEILLRKRSKFYISRSRDVSGESGLGRRLANLQWRQKHQPHHIRSF
jgi:hypothetical protein